MVENEQSLETVLPNFRKYVGDTTIIAHNAKFDLKFLNYYLDLLGLEPINNHICTLEMLKKCKSYKGKNKKLQNLTVVLAKTYKCNAAKLCKP